VLLLKEDKYMKLLEFEGIDGSGKTTAMKYFVEKLKSRGYKVLDTREVGCPHIPVCVSLRETILNPAHHMDGMAMEFVFGAMRIENQRFYESVKDEYDFIVSDRGLLSHMAYSDHNINVQATKDFFVDVVFKRTRSPDLVVFLSLEPDTALKRRGARNGFVDAIEAKGPEFQKKVYESFIKYIDQLELNVSKIDANQSIDGVRLQLDKLVDLLEGLR
jgi:dTMP kinase